MPTPSETITIAEISQYLCVNDLDKKGLYAGGVDLQLPRKIYMIRKNLEWLYDQDPDDETLQGTANYLYALCGKYALAAQNISGSGGSVAPISPTTRPDQLNFTVAASGTPLVDGDTTKIFSSFVGYNLTVVKNSQPLDQITTKPIYYTWNRDTGEFITNQATITGDEWQITPV